VEIIMLNAGRMSA